MRRWSLALLCAGLLALALPVPVRAATTGVAPATAAWYDAAYPTKTAAPPPPEAGVAAGQLLVAGATASTALLPSTPLGSLTASRPSAVAALSYVIPAGSSPTSLTLLLSGRASTAALGTRSPLGVSPVACPATGTFTGGGQQAFDQVPAYDCSGRTSLGALSSDGASVVFSDIAAIARGKLLAFVVLPGTLGADRLVFTAPGPSSLGLLSFDTAPAFSPAGQPQPPQPADGRSVDPAPATGGSASTPGLTPPISLGGPVPGSTAGTPPGAAPAATAVGGAAAAPPTAALAPAVAASNRIELLLGLGLLAAAALALAVTDRDRRRTAEEAAVWGVGHHRATREGRAPAL